MRSTLVLPFVGAFAALALAGPSAHPLASQELAGRDFGASAPTLNFPTVSTDDEDWTGGAMPVAPFEHQDASGLFERGEQRIRSRGYSAKEIQTEIKRLRARTALKRKQGLARIAAAAIADKKVSSKVVKMAQKVTTKKAAPKKAAKKAAPKKAVSHAAAAPEVKANIQLGNGGFGIGVNVGSGSGSGVLGLGLIGFTSSNCGSSGASSSEPNGAESFLSCGIKKSSPSSGWTPPKGVTMAHLKTVSIEDAMAGNSVWEPCKPFVSLFEKHANANNIPPILLASFALQESTCNPHVLGDGGGAFGLMQITKDKCGGQGAAACASPDYNIKTAAAYFASQLSSSGGEFLVALGAYNGWYSGMSFSDATAMADSGCCECQQNLDYLYQMLNGWLLGKTGYTLGSVKNLHSCSNQS
ncbi:hypothetical protein RQP46_000816 [Phenoliferia psychrophenolica]